MRGDKICQLVIQKVEHAEINITDHLTTLQGVKAVLGVQDDDREFLGKWIKVEEDFEIYRHNNVLDVVTKFEGYKKISRFNKDKEYMNIRD